MTTLCEPMLLKAAGKHSLWGGDKLIKEYGKDYLKAPLAETWECSTHENGLSYVDSGIWKGRTLKSVLKEHPEFLGSKYSSSGDLPVLIKFIDANKDLSVQVHPNDEYAARYENGARGKTEMWYVVEAAQGSQLIYGFYDNVSENIVREKIATGKLMEILQKVPVNEGDVFFIPPGTVHALCGGVIVVEVQESSDLTYRLYDFDRCDNNGKKRELHIDKALEICNYYKQNAKKNNLRVFSYKKGIGNVELCWCNFFVIDRKTFYVKEDVCIENKHNFCIYICICGNGFLKWETKCLSVTKGDTIFIPATLRNFKISGELKFICACC